MPEISVETIIVGSRWKGSPALAALAKMMTGCVVTLQREPDNRTDPMAVACYYLGLHVGYIPRRNNPRIAQALDRGIPVSCTVRELPVMRNDRIVIEPKLIVRWRVS